MGYRVIAIVCMGLALAACEGNSDFFKADWAKSSFRFEPPLQTVHFESEPAGAEAKTSNGQSCRTPCALALPGDKPLGVTFSLPGYQIDNEQIELVSMGNNTSELRPNPVLVELTPLPPPPKPTKKKFIPKRKVTAKPAPKRVVRPTAAAPAPPPPMTAAPAAQAPSPWPTNAPSR